MTKKSPTLPPERNRTIRQAILVHLREGPCTTRDLSRLVGIREKDVVPHLEHLQKSLHRGNQRLVVEPAACGSCGFVFEKRKRLSRPGSCPSCRGTHIDPPAFRVEPGDHS